MNIITWIKNLFNKQPVEPVNDAWIDMAKRLNEKEKKLKEMKEAIAKVEQFKKTVRNASPVRNIPAPPPAPPTRIVRDDVSPDWLPLQTVQPYYHTNTVKSYYETPCRSSHSSSSSDESSSRYSCSSDNSYSGGGGSFDGGGSSSSGSDW